MKRQIISVTQPMFSGIITILDKNTWFIFSIRFCIDDILVLYSTSF